MPKINQEEYEILEGLDDRWKWIARDEAQQTYVYEYRPIKSKLRGQWESNWNDYYPLPHDWFQFIKWEDESPYNIADLIQEYEYSAEHVSHLVNERVKALGKTWSESEEREVKNIEWLKETLEERIDTMAKFEDVSYSIGLKEAYQHTLLLINQLDEPEVLSQEWIDEHKYFAEEKIGEDAVVKVRDLRNLLVPKQEREQKYYVDLDTAAYVAKWDGNDQVDIYTDGISGSDEFEFHLTEQEIKDYDERFWPFAVKVEELEE